MTSRRVACGKQLLLIGAVAFVLAGILFGGFTTFQFLDRAHVARLILHGRIPYRDFPLEYPPAAGLLFFVSWLIGHRDYDFIFRLLMAISWAFIAFRVHKSHRDSLVAFLVLSVFSAWLIGAGFDIVVALSVWMAWEFFEARKSERASVAIGVGIAFKLTPGLLAPFVLRQERRNLWVVGGVLVAAIAISVVIPRAIAPHGYDPLTFQTGRPLHAESLAGTLIVIKRYYVDHRYPVVISANSRSIPDANEWRLSSSIALLVFLIGLWVLADPRRPSAWAAALIAIPGLGPIASPQFLVWPIGLMVLCSRAAQIAYATSIAISFAIFGGWLGIREGPTLAWLTLARNLFVFLTLAITARDSIFRRS